MSCLISSGTVATESLDYLGLVMGKCETWIWNHAGVVTIEKNFSFPFFSFLFLSHFPPLRRNGNGNGRKREIEEKGKASWATKICGLSMYGSDPARVEHGRTVDLDLSLRRGRRCDNKCSRMSEICR